jgi:chromosome segregation protein
MRLQSLKLAGFKSFVDPVTLRFPDAMTAIVGPNGCGKSNVIDAIRWVMGESSARQLRGEAMSDVIFAGSSARKPVGQASVELVFENTFGKLGGAYSSYTELSIRRQVTRDGRSDYFLNGTRCRRRDITDIFLGTGLGSRSYAVIGQGMINRLVEAKPDELRVFLEEAAGVSRYQARRRETQDHLEHTRLNLSRLHDVAEELSAQMRSLKRQSQAAERYKALQQEQHELQVAIWSDDHARLQRRQDQHTALLTQQGEALRGLRSERQATDQAWDAIHQQLEQALAQAEQQQHLWQAAEQQFASTDATNQALQRQIQQAQIDQQQLAQQIAHAADQQATDQQMVAGLQRRLRELIAELALFDGLSGDEQHTQVLKQQIEHSQSTRQTLELQLRQLDQQLQQLQHQQQLLSRDQERRRIQVANAQQELQKLELARVQEDLADLDAELDDIHLQQAKHQQQHDEQHSQQQQQLAAQLEGKRVLDDLIQQQRALQTELRARQALLPVDTIKTEHPTLAMQLQIQPEGQHLLAFLEIMYADWLQAIDTDQLPQIQQRCYQPQDIPDAATCPIDGATPLSAWVIAPMLSLWQQVWVVADVAYAMTVREQLSIGQSLLTSDGYWVGRDWLVNVQPKAIDQDSAIGQGELSQRARIDVLTTDLSGLLPRIHSQQAMLDQLKPQIDQQQRQLEQLRREQQQHQQRQQQLQIQRARLDSTLQARQQQAKRLAEQIASQQREQGDDDESVQELNLSLAAVQIKRQPLAASWQQLEQELGTLQQQYASAQQHSHQQRQQQQRLQLEHNTAHTRLELLEQAMARQAEQLALWQQQQQRLQQDYAELCAEQPILQAAYEQALQQVTQLRQLNQSRQHTLQQQQAESQALSQRRSQLEQHERDLRDAMETERLAWQDCKTQMQHLIEQLGKIDATVQTVEPDQGQRHERLAEVERQIARLGELNLAAPAALAEITARYDELQHQIQDLESTISQLEQAMRTIDQETRSLFMSTFDRVNTELQVLFPKVFGGGQASLTLEEGWQSGVRLMAQPPGKKNSSIALLSGGEKALTALALVFAIFRLNPAPFCLLDEVDAPLDDANVQRFCNLVQELSAQVQFIYISHNKLAMMMAHDLLGVTMPEAGVSRLVSVNIEQAAAFGVAQE